MTLEDAPGRPHQFPPVLSRSLLPITLRKATLPFSSAVPTFPHIILLLRDTLSFSPPTVNQIDKLFKL